MIIVKLMGGLGNQMFQYAFGRTLAYNKRTELYLDCTYLNDRTPKENFTFRNYELDIFRIDAKIATQRILENAIANPKTKIDRYKLKILDKLNLLNHITEETYNPSLVMSSSNRNYYVSGFWQSERYFLSYSDKIRSNFKLNPNLSSYNQSIFFKILENNSVSLHVRRGDYINNPHHILCGLEYYEAALNIILEKIENPVFIVFSDDIDWVKQNLHIPYTSFYCTGNTGKDTYLDMYLMSKCKHNIIANSSFSWWGAWLNRNNDKLVIAPNDWFPNSNLDETNKIIPDNWIKI